MNKGTLTIVLQLVGVGWYVGICIIGGLFGGLWIDRRFGVMPAFTLAGIVLGTVMGFYGIYKMLLPLLTDERDLKKLERER